MRARRGRLVRPRLDVTRDEVRAEIFNRKINAAADAYLAELRADAVIRKP